MLLIYGIINAKRGNFTIMSKKLKLFIALLAGAAVIILFLYTPGTEVNSLSCSSTNNSRTDYYIEEKLGFQFFIMNSEQAFINKKVLKVSRGSSIRLDLLRSSGSDYAALIDQRWVKLYKDGKCVSKYYAGSEDEGIMSSFIADFNNDGSSEIFLLLKYRDEEYGDNLIILSYSGDFKEVYKGSFKNINPWKVQVCDVDGDGEMEISLGAYTKAVFNPIYAKRPFIYNFIENNLYPKWLGSRLSKQFDGYVFNDMDGDGKDELIAIEILSDNQKELNSYKWKGFGFESTGSSEAFSDISDIKTDDNGIAARVKTDNTWKRAIFEYAHGMITNRVK